MGRSAALGAARQHNRLRCGRVARRHGDQRVPQQRRDMARPGHCAQDNRERHAH